MQIQMVMFSEPKAGHAPGEWEDCACGGIVGDAAPGQVPQHARFVVVDGATEAYDSLRWVDQLVTSFALQADAAAAPRLEPAAMRAWFARMQDRWARESPTAFDSIIEERKFTEVGSFATLLGCELSGLDGPEPSWKAVALGDTVLFHVRRGHLLATFPPLGPNDFGTRPDGVSTLVSIRKSCGQACGQAAPARCRRWRRCRDGWGGVSRAEAAAPTRAGLRDGLSRPSRR
jgi:hypothetical protein